MPKVSVIMNCRNGERFVKEAIASIYAQTFADWEIVFFDNASTDRTAEIAGKFDGRLRYVRNERTVPIGAARRSALALARGEWAGFLDHDDQYLPQFLERQMAALAGSDYVLGYTGYSEVDQAGKVLRDVVPRHRSGAIIGDLLRQYEIGLLTALVNVQALRRFNIDLDASLALSEDYNLLMRIAAKGRVSVLPDVLGLYRIVASSGMEQEHDRQANEVELTLDALRRENPGIEARHPAAFREAAARATYYRARSFMTLGRVGEARGLLKQIRRVREIYFVLYVVSFWPALWRKAHMRETKSRLTRIFSTFAGALARRRYPSAGGREAR